MLQVLESDPTNLCPWLHEKETVVFIEYGPLPGGCICPLVKVGSGHVLVSTKL